jgi:HORMA domain
MKFSTEEEDDGGPTKQEISKSTTQLVRRLLLMTQSLDPLPEHAYITIRYGTFFDL